MQYNHPEIQQAAQVLRGRYLSLEDKTAILRAVELKALYDQLKLLPPEQRAGFGLEVNKLKEELEHLIADTQQAIEIVRPIDVTAPWDTNIPPERRPHVLPSEFGSQHPLMKEMDTVLDILGRMGFEAVESRQLDDDFHMFSALNFPDGHPARDDYDTFVTDEGLIAPAHTSTMQHRILKQYLPDLEDGKGIRVVIPGRVFRNEDLDARHEHTFYQLEGIYVDRGIHAGHLIATLQKFLSEYYQQTLNVKTQPYYFPFTEPSFEFAMSCPFCQQNGCTVCSYSGWIELLGCGMIHPNVLEMAGIDHTKFSGFAWGGGIDRLVMMKQDIEDIRHFESGKLEFLRQFR